MSERYTQVNPSLYMDKMDDGTAYPDYNKLVGVPIKIGRDETTNELFDQITKQLIEDGKLSEINGSETFYEFEDTTKGYPITNVFDNGKMVTFNEDGILVGYEENQLKKEEVENEVDNEVEEQEYDEEEEELDFI